MKEGKREVWKEERKGGCGQSPPFKGKLSKCAQECAQFLVAAAEDVSIQTSTDA